MKLKLVKWALYCTMPLTLWACATTNTPTKDEKPTKIVTAAQINTQLGLGYLEHQEVQRAKQKLLLALQEAPQIPETWYSMAYFLEVTGETEQAKADYLKAISLAPQRGDVHNNYGTFLCRAGDYPGAIDHFLLAVKDPDYVDSASAYENAGLCAMKIPDKKLALHYFNQAILQDPNYSTSLFEAAKLNYEEGDYSIAIRRIDEFLALMPETPAALQLRAKINKKLA